MTKRQFERFCENFFKEMYELVPKKTCTLADAGLKMVYEDENTCKIYILPSFIPEYMTYTNEPWISPKWNGKKNPNESWWNNAFMLIAQELAPKYNGVFGQGNHYVLNNEIMSYDEARQTLIKIKEERKKK